MQHALIDSDILIYRVGFSTHLDTENVALQTMDSYIEGMLLCSLPSVETWELFLTGKGNFREDIAKTAVYKGNRAGNEKPTHYKALRSHLISEWDAKLIEGMEADDELAIRATELGDSSVIVTLDKDLDQVKGWHYNFVKRTTYYISEEQGMLNFYMQFLTGDNVDNIKGVHGIGPKKALKLLEGKTEMEMWQICVELLGSRERAVENAHLLYMLRRAGEHFLPPDER
jgi:hypothetical protein